MDEEFDDIFDKLDKMFGNTPKYHQPHTSKYIDTRASERIIDKDKIYYTLSVNELNKDEISVDSYNDRIEVIISKGINSDSSVITTPYKILPEKTIAKYNNGLLDITTFIDMDKTNKVDVE